jgi:hypothetical protein
VLRFAPQVGIVRAGLQQSLDHPSLSLGMRVVSHDGRYLAYTADRAGSDARRETALDWAFVLWRTRS